MASISPVEHPQHLKYKTCILKVSINCAGCRRKVKKVLQNIEGVYTTTIDLQQQRVNVSGNIDAETLIKKLDKSGKHAEIWPEKPSRKEKSNKTKNNVADKKSTTINSNSSGKENADPVKAGCAGEKPQASEQKNGGERAGKKKKKRKGLNRNNTTTAAADTGVLYVTGNVEPNQAPDEIDMSTTIQCPYDLPPSSGPQQTYMMSFNTAHPVQWMPANPAFEMFSDENSRGCCIM